ncbi:MAG TPA: FtsX-like permease family protein [Solirubrobacteraceae bacterium]|nr:FtsX-like permease family protein [Solirubrobacteraceae bacterium]
MRLGTIFYLYRVRLRARLVQELLAVAGIAVGVALLFASQVANTSLSGSVSQLTNGLVGNARLQVTARSPLGFSEHLLSEVDRIEGVAAAAPVLQRSISIVGPKGRISVTLVGLNPRFLRLNGTLLSHLSTTQIASQQGIALPAPIADHIGADTLQPVLVQVGDRSTRMQVGAILQASDVGELIDSQLAISPLGRAQEAAGMRGSINRILVEPRNGHDSEVLRALRKLAAGRLNVVPANFEATVFSQAEGPTVQSTQMFSAISALVGFLFAFNAMLLTVPQRRNLIADLRLDGYTPLEIVEVMLFDVFALGVAGVVVGLALGDLLSHGLLQAQPGYLSLAFPVGSQHVVRWQSVVIAVAGGLIAAVIGVLVPLRRDILSSSTGDRRQAHTSKAAQLVALCCGLLFLAIASVILIAGISTVGAAIFAFVSLTFALLLVMPTAFGLVVALIDRAQRPMFGVAPRIALIELMSNATRPRSLAIAATGAIAVFGSVAIEGAQGNLRSGLSRAASDLSGRADLWVTPAGGATTLATTPFANSYYQLLAGLPDVAHVSIVRGGFLDIGNRRVLVLAPSSNNPQLLPSNQVTNGSVAAAAARLRTGGWIALSRNLASQWNLSVGDSVVVPSPHPRRFRVAAVTTNLGWSPGTIIMNAGQYATAWGSDQISAYQITLKPGIAVGAGAAQVRATLRQAPGLVVQSTARHEQNDLDAQRQGLARLTQIAALVLIAAALAMAAAMGAMIWQRRGRLAGMKVDGYSSGELWRALLWETAVLLSAGCTIGALFGLYGQLVLSHALVSVTGFPVIFSIGLPVAVISFVVVTAIALGMVALPGYLAAQVKPALQD